MAMQTQPCSSSHFPSSSDRREDLPAAVQRAQKEARDAKDCLETVVADLDGTSPEIDALDHAFGDKEPPTRRVRAMCLRAAADLERAATRLRRAVREADEEAVPS